jgi:hypothetical protein
VTEAARETCPFCEEAATETCRYCGGLFCTNHVAHPDHLAIDEEYGFIENPVIEEDEPQ